MKIVNIMATGKASERIDLEKFARQSVNVQYAPRRFQPVVVRSRHPVRATFLLYSSGSIICTGATSKSDAFKAIRRLERKIQHVFPHITVTDLTLQSMTVSTKLSYKLNLEHIRAQVGARKCSFEAEIFPGLFFYPATKPNMKAVLFRSGKINILGARNMDDSCAVFEELIDYIV